MDLSIQPKGTHPPMTAAERQRLCRARGKGRHRGRRLTRADLAAYRAAMGTPAQEPAATAPIAAAPPPPSTNG